QIAWCLAHYYGHITELGERLLQPENAEPRAQAEPQPAQRPRVRGVTSQIAAARRKGIVPGEAFAPTAAPATDAVLDAPPAVATDVEPTGVRPRAKTASGEIRIPRAAPVEPPREEDGSPVVVLDADSGPIDPPPPVATTQDDDRVIEIEADVGSPYEPVLQIGVGDSKPVPKRRRPAEPDPPELAARAGEVQLATGQPIKKIEFDEPRIIISDDLAEELARPRERPSAPEVDASGEVRVREHEPHAAGDDELS